MAKKKASPGGRELGRRLTVKEVDTLDRLLAERAAGIGGIEALDGFLAAVIAGPELVPPSEVMAAILGDPDQVTFDSMAEARVLSDLIMRHWNAIATGLLTGDYLPILTQVDGVFFGNDWAVAFLDGVALREKGWRPFLEHRRHADLLEPLFALAVEHHPDKKIRGPRISPARRARFVGALGPVAVTARRFFLLSASAGAAEPEAPDHWEAGWVPITATIEAEPNARLVAILIVTGDGRVLRITPQVNPPADPAAMARVFAKEVEEALREEDRPAEVWVRDQATATALRRLPGMRGVIIEIRDQMPQFEEARERFSQHLSGPGASGLATSAPSWSGWGIEPALVAELFRAAAALYRAAPWRHYGDADPIALRWPSGLAWAVAVMGASRIERGLLCFTDPRDVDTFATGAVPSPKDFRGQMVSISYSALDDLPPAMRKEIAENGWEVAAPEAYPMVMVINAPTAGLTPEMAERLREAIEVMARFAGTKTRRRVWSWKDRATGIVVEQG